MSKNTADVPSDAHGPAIDCQPSIPAVPSGDKRATNWIADQSGDGDDGKQCARPNANLAYVRYLRNQGRREGDERSAAEAVEHGEDDDWGVAGGWDPEREHDYTGEAKAMISIYR